MSYDNHLDAYIQRLQCIQPVLLHTIDFQTGQIAPHLWITGGDLARDLVIREDTLRTQVDVIATQIMYWGRLRAQAKRVWEAEERHYRVWRDSAMLQLIDSAEKKPTAADSGKSAKTDKRPTKEMLEMHMRQHQEYGARYSRVEAAEEVYNTLDAAVSAFKAKDQMLQSDVFRVRDGSLQRRTV